METDKLVEALEGEVKMLEARISTRKEALLQAQDEQKRDEGKLQQTKVILEFITEGEGEDDAEDEGTTEPDKKV